MTEQSLASQRLTELVDAARTGVAGIDRHLERIARTLLAATMFKAPIAFIRACVAIINNEGGWAPPPLIGDRTLAPGPSIGPMQVYRKTAKDYGLWMPSAAAMSDEVLERAEYETLAKDEAICLRMGVAVFLKKLREAKGNLPNAIRRYNGGGVDADTYRDMAIAFATEVWGADGLQVVIV